MSRYLLSVIISILFVLAADRSFGQCHHQDTARVYRVLSESPSGVAISNTGKIAVSAYKLDTGRTIFPIRIWNDVYDFMSGSIADDTIMATTPEAVAYDDAGNLYVVQTSKSDSNILIYNAALTLVRSFNNSASARWFHPRGISLDVSRNIYVISGDSITTGATIDTFHNTGKLIKITDPFGTASRSVLLNGLKDPKAVVVKSTSIYLSEYDGNEVSRYDSATMNKLDSVTIIKPMDLAVRDCKMYVTEHGSKAVKIFNAFNFGDAGLSGTILKPGSIKGKFGTQLNRNFDLFVCNKDSNKVVFFKGARDYPYVPPVDSVGGYVDTNYLGDNWFCINTTLSLPVYVSGYWYSTDTNIAKLDTLNHLVAIGPGIVRVFHINGSDSDWMEAIVEIPDGPAGTLHTRVDGIDVVGSTTVCLGNTVKLTGAIPSLYSVGIWSVSDESLAELSAGYTSGVVWPMNSGTVTVTYSVGNSCGVSSTSMLINIVDDPDPGVIRVSVPVAHEFCGLTAQTAIDSGASIPGTWSVSGASVTAIDVSGNLTVADTGASVITYTVSNRCGTNSATYDIHVYEQLIADSISTVQPICIGADSLFTTTGVTGGKWRSSNDSVLVIDSISGHATGMAGGSADIQYIVSTAGNHCPDTAFRAASVVGALHAGGIIGVDSVCVNSTIALSDTGGATGGRWSSSNSGVATVDTASGVVYGVSQGTAVITYKVTNPCDMQLTTRTILVKPLPEAGAISGATSVCSGANISLALSGADPGGTWSSNNSAAAVSSSGVVTGNTLTTTSVVIKYLTTNTCGSDSATHNITVNPLPNPGTITGADSVCSQATIALSASGTTGGTWSSSNSSIASVSSTGSVRGNASSLSTATISYTVSTASCGNATATHNVTVKQLPNAGSLDGPNALCPGDAGSYIVYSGMLGGVWSTSDASIAVASPAGTVANVTSDFNSNYVAVNYTVNTFSCGSATATMDVLMKPIPHVNNVDGPTVACTGDSAVYSQSSNYHSFPYVYGYGWFISDTAVLRESNPPSPWDYDNDWFYFTHPGTTYLQYSFGTSCGSSDYGIWVTVYPSPIPGTITGPSTVCSGLSINLTDPTGDPGGTWTSSNAAVAAVSSSGVVTAAASVVTPTTVTIKYTVGTAHCGSAFTTKTITVNPTPNAGSIVGADSVCAGSAIALSDPTSLPGGVWSSSNTAIASVSPSGIVSSSSSLPTYYTAIITYTSTTACGVATAQHPVTVKPIPVAGSIDGPGSVCPLAPVNYHDPSGTPGGTWSSSNTAVATVDAFGLVHSSHFIVTPTPFFISYTINVVGCGSATTSVLVVANPQPDPGTITGSNTGCPGTSAPLTVFGGIGGGSWTSNAPAVADVTSGNLNFHTPGTTTVNYVVSNMCGTDSAVFPVTVLALPNAGVVTGPDSICSGGGPVSYVNVGGDIPGTWLIHGAPIASIDLSGTLSPSLLGNADVVYKVSNTCGADSAMHHFTILPSPLAGPITGSSTVCQGLSITLSNTTGTPGGAWTTSNAAIASVSASTGVVTGVASTLSTATVTYTVSTFSCGSAFTTYAVTVNPLPVAGTITGPDSVCSGASVSLSDITAVPAGTWSILDPSVATISASGVVTSLSSVLATTGVVYTAVTSCGSATATHPLTVKALPFAGVITGPDSVCSGSSISLFTSGLPGGAWSSSGFATVTAGGIVTGAATALTTGTITYTSTTFSCGSTSATHTVTVKPLPAAGIISGASSVCQGSSISLAETVPGGTWSVSGTGIASISSTGVVTGTATTLSTANVTYTTTTFSCGSATASFAITVNPLPIAGVITGPDSVCSGAFISLANLTGTPGGIWTSSNTAIATVSGSGVVTAVGSGLATLTITYTVTTVCGTVSTTHLVTVKPLPDAGIISGPSSVCSGSSITLAESTFGGTWTSSNPLAANVSSATGVVIGNATTITTAIISYTATTFSCGSATATFIVTVNPLPVAGVIAGADSVCSGSAISLTNTTGTPGSVWSSSSSAIATVSATGVVTGVSATLATTTITYAASTACGTVNATHLITVKPLPFAGTISGTSVFCSGTSVTLSDAVTGGTWSSASPGVATVSSAGVVTGISTASASTTISYSVSTFSCGTAVATFAVSVTAPITAGTIVGDDSVCSGGGIALTNTSGTTAGVWGSVRPSVATISATGIVTGLSPVLDTVTITYFVTASCGTATATYVVTVLPAMSAGTISGPDSVCAGATISLSGSPAGGVWSSSNTSLATVSGAGIVTGAATTPSGVNIIYTISGFCGSAFSGHSVFVNLPPSAGIINGPSTVCIDSAIMLTETVPGGFWLAANSNATVSGGVVTGVAVGVDAISYAVANTCGTSVAQTNISIVSCAPAGIVTYIKTDAKIYPNPATDELTIEVDDGIYTQATIIDNTGVAVISTQIKSTRSVIDISRLASGVYYIRLVGDMGTEVKKFVKL